MLKKLNIGFIKKKIKATESIKKNSYQQEPQFSLRLYRGVDDCKMWNFRKVLETGDLRYLYKLEDYYELPKQYPELKVWEDLFWEYIEKKGLDHNFKMRIELKARIAILEYEQIFEGKKKDAIIEFSKLKLQELNNQFTKGSDFKNDAVLTKFIGVHVNPKTHTVADYIGFEKLLNEANEQARKQNDSNKN